MYRFLRLACIGLIIALYFATSSAQEDNNASNSGTIMAIDIHQRTIEVNQKKFVLADNLQVFSPKGFIISQLILAPGQKIQYTTSNQALDNGAGMQNTAITSIHIVGGYKESSIKQ